MTAITLDMEQLDALAEMIAEKLLVPAFLPAKPASRHLGIGENRILEIMHDKRYQADPFPYIRNGNRQLVDMELAPGWLRRHGIIG